MKKFKIFIDYEQEERWINDMCAQGWHLKKITLWTFTFEKSEPGKYIYRNTLLTYVGDQSYSEFLVESGVEIVCVFGNTVYLKKRADEGPFEVYSDDKLRLKNINNAYWPLLSFFVMNLIVGITNASFINGYTEEFLGWANILFAIATFIPLFFVYKIRKHLKSKLILHD